MLALVLALTPASAADLSGLAFMAGCWSQDGRDAGSTEQWTLPAGGTMLGMMRTVRDGRTVGFEFLRIEAGDDGDTWLTASPSGQETARFRLVSASVHEVAFENPQHDFPQRISYRLLAPGRLLGRISGTIDGEQRTVEFPMTRMPCAGNEDQP